MKEEEFIKDIDAIKIERKALDAKLQNIIGRYIFDMLGIEKGSILKDHFHRIKVEKTEVMLSYIGDVLDIRFIGQEVTIKGELKRSQKFPEIYLGNIKKINNKQVDVNVKALLNDIITIVRRTL